MSALIPQTDTQLVVPKGTRRSHGAKRSVRFILLAVGFGGLLLLPLLGQLTGLATRFQNTENRQLRGLPTFHFPHLRTFVAEFDLYFKENFGFRNALFHNYSRWKYNVLHQSPLPEKVVIGKNGWLFVGNSYNKVVDQHRGLVQLSDHTLKAITDRLTARQQELNQQGIRFYLLIAPDAHAVYADKLPNCLRRTSAKVSPLDRLKRYLSAHSSIPLVDPRHALQQARRNYPVYYQADTHWNEPGALIGCEALVNRIRQDVPQLCSVTPKAYRFITEPGQSGDLGLMLALQEQLRDSVNYTAQLSPQQSSCRIAEVRHTHRFFPSVRYTGFDAKQPRLLLFGDSFSYNMIKFLPAYFSQSFHTYQTTFDAAVVRRERPDIVVLEIVERDIDQLALF